MQLCELDLTGTRGPYKPRCFKSSSSLGLSRPVWSLLSLFLPGVPWFCPAHRPVSSLPSTGSCLVVHREHRPRGYTSQLETRRPPALSRRLPASCLLGKTKSFPCVFSAVFSTKLPAAWPRQSTNTSSHRGRSHSWSYFGRHITAG